MFLNFLTLCLLGNFAHAFCRLLMFFKIIFLKKKNFRNTVRVSNILDPCFVWPEEGPNCLQSADDTFRQRVKLSLLLPANKKTANVSYMVTLRLTLNGPIATKVVSFSQLLKCLSSLYGKQCGPRADCSYRSSLFWVHAVCFYT